MKRVLLLSAGLFLAICSGWALANLPLGSLGQAATLAAAVAGGALALMGMSTGGAQGSPAEPAADHGHFSMPRRFTALDGSGETSSSNADSGSSGGSDGGSSGSSSGE